MKKEGGAAAKRGHGGRRQEGGKRRKVRPQTNGRHRTAPQAGGYFAIDSVAPRPVKPCDGGVFGALDLLLKTECKAPGPKPMPSLAGMSRPSQPKHEPLCLACMPSGCKQVFWQLFPQPPAFLPGLAGFATDLIATKLLKTCDGSVFGAFYSLLLLQQTPVFRDVYGL